VTGLLGARPFELGRPADGEARGGQVSVVVEVELDVLKSGRDRTIRGLDFAETLEVDWRIGLFRQDLWLEAAIGVQDERPNPDGCRSRRAGEQHCTHRKQHPDRQ